MGNPVSGKGLETLEVKKWTEEVLAGRVAFLNRAQIILDLFDDRRVGRVGIMK